MTSFPTPDNSVIGQTRKAPDEFDEQHITKRQRIDNELLPAMEISHQEPQSAYNISWQQEAESQASDQQPAVSGYDSAADVQSEKIADETTQPAPVEMSLEQLQKNVGEVFHLCKSGKIALLVSH